MAKDKHICDSVHGDIAVPEQYIKYVIDTPEFQRLRRIEQTSIRSTFPSARHDRFIHSLGVYYVGTKFCEAIRKGLLDDNLAPQANIDSIEKSYNIACLLHDIAHAPFSHTFESFYGTKQELFNRLCTSPFITTLQNEHFNIDNANYHEYASAIVVCEKFGYTISNVLQGNVELICRMIIGCQYGTDHELENCYIQLLNGAIADADRLDYACRDVWASGYATSAIDVRRIASATHIKPNPETGKLVLCYDNNAITEIFNMIEVRQFQNKYIITHHTVQYEQAILIKAAEIMALHQLPNKPSGEEALSSIISLESVMGTNQVSQNLSLKLLCDDDIIHLVKQDIGNKYYDELEGRSYTRFALWKNPSEFFQKFPDIATNASFPDAQNVVETNIRAALKQIVPPDDIIIQKVKYKSYISPANLFLIVNNKVEGYNDVYPQYFRPDNPNQTNDVVFYYVYIPHQRDVEKEVLCQKACDALKPVLSTLAITPDKRWNAIIFKRRIQVTFYKQ